MTVDDVLAALERLAPASLAEEWDNVGLIVGRRGRAVAQLLVALELRDSVLDEALAGGFDAILTHHPPIFPALARVADDTAELVLRAAESRVAILSAHTNLDSAAGGLNDVMAERLQVFDTRPLQPAAGDPAVGLGRVGRWSREGSLADLAAVAGTAFDGAPCSYVGDPSTPVTTIACCTGSGASLLADAAASGADVYVTSDLKYHDADRAPGLALIALPHAQVERVAMRAWAAQTFTAALAGVDVVYATSDTDPWRQAG